MQTLLADFSLYQMQQQLTPTFKYFEKSNFIHICYTFNCSINFWIILCDTK